MKTYTTFKDGVKITTKRTNGKYIAIINYRSGDVETVTATFSTLCRTKAELAIKLHFSGVIKSLADVARSINANARRNNTM